MDTVTREQMAELDRVMIEEMGIGVPIMMEHAALAVSRAAVQLAEGKRVLVLAGHGNNGGDGLAAARHLANWGYQVDVICASPPAKYRAEPLKQLRILESMGVAVSFSGGNTFSGYGLIIDALLGYHLEGSPKGVFAELIGKANASGVPVLAVDIPSGLDATTGKAYSPRIRAAATVSLSVPKTGLREEPAKEYAGRVMVAYMGVPDSVYAKLGIRKMFSGAETLREL